MVKLQVTETYGALNLRETSVLQTVVLPVCVLRLACVQWLGKQSHTAATQNLLNGIVCSTTDYC